MLLGSIWFAFVMAEDRNLPGIDLISRAEWWADETMRYQEDYHYQAMLKAREEWSEEMDEMRDTDFEQYLKEQQKVYERQRANEYLMENFAEDFSIDEHNDYHNGNEVWTRESFHFDKIEMIVHHTATSYSGLNTKSKILDYLIKTYKFHAFKRGRGDIGYNFIIDPMWWIYEWRAGGAGVVGMHAAWNNTPSIGIALMWNFEIEEPTQTQIDSLTKLLTALARKYGINPHDTVMYHRKSRDSPYIESNLHYTIAGHTDAWHTACPWRNLYNKLPDIRKMVKQNLLRTELLSSQTSKIVLPWIIYSNQDVATLTTRLYGENIVGCKTSDQSFDISDCSSNDWKLSFRIQKKHWFSSGKKQFTITTDNGRKIIVQMLILWQSDLDPFVAKMKEKYITHPATNLTNKITSKITLQEAKQLMQDKIRVLLHEISQLDNWDVKCDQNCTFVLDDKSVIIAKTWTISKSIQTEKNTTSKYLKLKINGVQYYSDQIYVSSENTPIAIQNFERTSYAGIPRNTFHGSLIFYKDQILDKSTDGFESKIVVVNSLDFTDYLKWIVETNDTEPLEKNKIMALIAKSYALFYMNGKNNHSSIPTNAGYNAIDDPDLFQKYVGAGLEKTLKKRYQALEATKDQVAIYDGYVPILPYFHCSVGVTLDAQSKRGRTDTPYLVSRLDLSRCRSLEWHGVWLSWKWANRRAKNGRNYKQILDYYYPGVEILG